MRYSRMLEESSFAHRKADYLWLLILSGLILLGLSPMFNLPFLSSPLANSPAPDVPNFLPGPRMEQIPALRG